MLDTTSESASDRRPAIVICSWDPSETACDLIEDLSGETWAPPGARTVCLAPGTPEELIAKLGELLGDVRTRAVLLVGRSERTGPFRLQLRAENHVMRGSERLDGTGPSFARSTAPVAEILRALGEAGIDAEATSEAEDDEGSFILYQTLANLPDDALTPAIGLLRAPAGEPDASVTHALKATAETMAQHLSPIPRRP